MGKRTTWTLITPLPPHIPRQLALDMLHSHTEVIELNPLVTGVESVEAPRDAAADEFFSQWYEISQIITWGFGIKKKITFRGVFHDQPWGLQTHIYAPMGVDMRNKYRIGGNEPGEPREARELGLETPEDGLYLREDVEIVCAVPLTASFVKKEAKAATATMIARLNKKAELLDQGKLHAMFENGRLKTSKPSTGPTYADRPIPSPLSTPSSPTLSTHSPSVASLGAVTDEAGFGRYHDIVQRQASQSGRPVSTYSSHQRLSSYETHALPRIAEPNSNTHEVQGSMYYSNIISHNHPSSRNNAAHLPAFHAELAGDTVFNQQSQPQTQAPPYSITDPEKLRLMNAQAPHIVANLADHPANRHSRENSLNDGNTHDSQNSYGSYNSYNSYTDATRPAIQEIRPDHDPANQMSQLNLNAGHIPGTTEQKVEAQGGSPTANGKTMNPRNTAQVDTEKSQTAGVRIIRCPVCNLFDGDAAAVSHHIEKLHFG